MNTSSWRKAADLIAQGTQANQQVQTAAIADSSQLESFPLALSADDSSPPQVNYGTEQPLAASTPRSNLTLTRETQANDTYHQIIPGMSEHLYPTLIADGSLSTPAADNCSTLQKQITSEIDKYLQEAAEKCERDDNYYDGQHVATNTSSPQQEANFLEEDDDAGSDEEADNANVPESDGQDTSVYYRSSTEHNIQPQDELETIPEEEEPQMEENQNIVDQDTVVFTPDESEEEPFNTAIDDTSDDPTIVMGKPVTTAFVSNDICILTEKVGCLQVTSQLQEFLNHFPPESIEKAFEQIYQILQVLDAYLNDNPQQHQYCMSPDSEYISLITYTTKIEINLCNFLAISAVLSILLDTKSNKLQYVKTLQQVVNLYYEKCPMKVVRRLEQQTSEILDVMYDSVTNQNFDRVSDDVDSVSGVVDNDSDKVDTDYIQMPYDNDNDNATGQMKGEQNMTNELKDIDTNDTVPYERNDNEMIKVKWSIESNDVDNDFLRNYENMHFHHKSIVALHHTMNHPQTITYAWVWV